MGMEARYAYVAFGLLGAYSATTMALLPSNSPGQIVFLILLAMSICGVAVAVARAVLSRVRVRVLMASDISGKILGEVDF